MERSFAIFLLVLAALIALPGVGQAQEGGERLRIGAGLVLDFAGGLEYDPPGRGNSVHDSPRVTPGLRVHLDYDVHRYVSVGGLLRFAFWRGDDADGRNMLVDIAARVNGHYDWREFRFYGVLALGPTVSRINPDNASALTNPGAGIAASFAPGLEWWPSRRVGLFTEIFGWTGHFFRHDFRGTSGRELIGLNQVLWQLGVLVAL